LDSKQFPCVSHFNPAGISQITFFFIFSRKQVIELVPNISEKYLEEVYEDLQILFDDDLILAGHSIENDLKYLQIYYPYIIDTSIIFNVSGTRLEKTSLQKLYAIFFG